MHFAKSRWPDLVLSSLIFKADDITFLTRSVQSSFSDSFIRYIIKFQQLLSILCLISSSSFLCIWSFSHVFTHPLTSCSACVYSSYSSSDLTFSSSENFLHFFGLVALAYYLVPYVCFLFAFERWYPSKIEFEENRIAILVACRTAFPRSLSFVFTWSFSYLFTLLYVLTKYWGQRVEERYRLFRCVSYKFLSKRQSTRLHSSASSPVSGG